MTGDPRTDQILQQAAWAAHAYAGYDRAGVRAIAEAVAAVAADQAEPFARRAVLETGFGRVEDKTVKNRLSSAGLLAALAGRDLVGPRVGGGTLSLPAPLGVVVALAPVSRPVSSAYRAILLALLTRNALVISPDPAVSGCVSAVVTLLGRAAVAAGAPDGLIQVAEAGEAARATLLAPGAAAAVLPAAGRPVNVPVFVDATARPGPAAELLVAGQAFDNGLLDGNESVLIVERPAAAGLLEAMAAAGAHRLGPADRDRVRALLFPAGAFDSGLIGLDAVTLAERAGVRVPAGTRALLAPIESARAEEPLAHPKRGPVLAVLEVADVARGLRAAAALVRMGPPHSAAIHSRVPGTVLDYAAAVRVPALVVDESGSLHDARSGPEPETLLGWTRFEVPTPDAIGLGEFARQPVGRTPGGPVPAYPNPATYRAALR